MIPAILLAMVWGVLAVAKALDPHSLQVYLSNSLSLSETVTGVAVAAIVLGEAALCVSVLFTLSGRLRAALVVSLVASTVLVGVALLIDDSTACGCLGRLEATGRGARKIVAGGLLFLSVAAIRSGALPTSARREARLS